MPISKAPNPGNMQGWYSVFKPDTSNEWKKYSSMTIVSGGEIPNFNKVTTLDNYCNEQGFARKPKPTEGEDEEKKLKTFCIV